MTWRGISPRTYRELLSASRPGMMCIVADGPQTQTAHKGPEESLLGPQYCAHMSSR